MKYRPEIDGLRTVAVVPVVLFHAGFQLFSGGFVGVDIFFVISGYLITSIIVSDLEQEKFSLLNFYERRARRILPALFFVLLACLPFAWLWLLPPDMKDFAQSLVAVSTFSSNILFWRETGYFATTSELKPLLHTWSLAVEEQYYIFFPLFMMITWRLGRRWVLGLIAVAFVVSLGLGHWGALNKPNAAFFLLPTRAWELLVGVFAAFYLHDYLKFHHGLDRRIHQALSLLGFLMVTYSIFVFDERTAFPGLPALVPTVGAGLIIMFASQGTWVNRLLSIKGFVGIGLISYSAYLWHNPLMVFARHRSLTEPSLWLMGGLCIVTLVMAYISWRYVELPFRNKQTTSRKFVFSGGATIAVAVIVVGIAGHFTKGFPARIPNKILKYITAKEDRNPFRSVCHFGPDGSKDYHIPHLPINECIFGPNKGNIQVALIGDSHADALAFPILKDLASHGITATQITVSGCHPFVGFNRSFGNCNDANVQIENYIRKKSISTVIIATRWTDSFYSEGFDNGEGGVEYGSRSFTFLPSFTTDSTNTLSEKAMNLWRIGVQRYIQMGKNVVLVYPIPEAGWSVPDTLARRAYFDDDITDLSTNEDKFNERNMPIIKSLDQIQSSKIARVKPYEILCDTYIPHRCVNSNKGKVFYFDDDHLSVTGASIISPEIVNAVLSFKNKNSTTAKLASDQSSLP